jgi:hypothetical protein
VSRIFWDFQMNRPKRHRRDIFVETKANKTSSPVGAAYFNDVAPTELCFLNRQTKDASPTGFRTITARVARDKTVGDKVVLVSQTFVACSASWPGRAAKGDDVIVIQ